MQKVQHVFPTQEIGSIAKPGWRVKGVSDEAKVTAKEIEEAEYWGKSLKVRDYERLISLLKERMKRRLTAEEKEAIRDFSVLYVLALFDSVGLDRVYSGEQWRVEMYEHLVRNIRGFKLLGSVHSFDNKYFTKGAIVDLPKYTHPIHEDEFEFVKKHTDKEIKIPITGPYTVVDWSFNEYYETKARASKKKRIDLRQTYFEARRSFMIDLVKNALRPEVENLIRNGAKLIQIDEPAITTRPDDEEMELFVEATNELTRGLDSKCAFSLHNCFSDYKLLARYAPRLKDIKQLALEFANRDSSDLGMDAATRPGYADITHFVDHGYKGEFGLGVVHIHDYTGKPGSGATLEGKNIIETPELVRDRILFATKLLKGDESRISVNPDCGLRTRSWEITLRKLKVVTEGAVLARKENN